MRIGLFTVGLGGAAYPDVIRAVAETSERVGVATLWAAEHVVLFDRYDSAYPTRRAGPSRWARMRTGSIPSSR